MAQPQTGVFIDISGYRVVRDERGKDFIVFIIKIRLGSFAWTVYRRFTQFRNLGEQLRRKIPDSPACPPKRLLGGHTPEFLEQRRAELLDWVRQLARDERVCRSPEFHEFLRAQANTPPPGLLDTPLGMPEGAPSPRAAESPAYPMAGMAEEAGRGAAGGSAAPSVPRHPAMPSAAGPQGLYAPAHLPTPLRGAMGGGPAASSADSVVSAGGSSDRVGLGAFALLKVVGKGSFGKVMQVRKKDTGRIYAMKVLHKSNIVRRNQVEHTRTERNVLGRIVHPFIVGLNFAFQTTDKLYFVLDYCLTEEHEVLTDRGFMSLTDLEAYDGPSLTFAGYDAAGRQIVYEPASRLVINPFRVQTVVEFTHEAEARRWGGVASRVRGASSAAGVASTTAARSGAAGEAASSGRGVCSNGVSLVVTPDHDMYARRGGIRHSTLTSGGVRVEATWGTEVGGGGQVTERGFAKVKAQELLARAGNEPAAVQFTAQAADGVFVPRAGGDAVPVSDLSDAEARIPAVTALSLATPEALAAFLHLLGFWLGGSSRASLKEEGAVSFLPASAAADDALVTHLTAAGLAEGLHFSRSAGGLSTRVTDSAWREYFAAEFVPECSGDGAPASGQRVGSYEQATATVVAGGRPWLVAAPSTGSTVEAAGQPSLAQGKRGRAMPPWVHALRKAEARCVLAGLCLAAGAEGAEESALFTASVQLRDEVVRLALHAGYSPHFALSHSTDGLERWQVSYSDASSVAQPVLHAQREVREVQYEGRTWCVTLPHGFILARRAARDPASGVVTQASRPVVTGNCAGGELFFHLGREGRFSEDRTRFYAAQIAEALAFLHAHGIVYRDLKPENVLLDHRGNVRLTDFGLSKENVHDVSSGAHSFCGTPEYLAPEVLNRSGHGRAVDWWSLGALMYEMMTGLPPFYCRDRNLLFEKIRKGVLEFPDYLSDNARDMLGRLLTRDPTQRLGCGPTDAQEIKGHPFFAGTPWKELVELKIPSPWVPVVASSLDTSQFDAEFTSMPLVSPSSLAAPALEAAHFGAAAKFEGFTFVAPHNMGAGRAAAAAAAAAAYGEMETDGPAQHQAMLHLRLQAQGPWQQQQALAAAAQAAQAAGLAARAAQQQRAAGGASGARMSIDGGS